MLQVVTQNCRFALTLATTVFFTIKTKFSNFRFLFYILAKIEDLKYFWKYFKIIDLTGAFTNLYSNKID